MSQLESVKLALVGKTIKDIYVSHESPTERKRLHIVTTDGDTVALHALAGDTMHAEVTYSIRKGQVTFPDAN